MGKVLPSIARSCPILIKLFTGDDPWWLFGMGFSSLSQGHQSWARSLLRCGGVEDVEARKFVTSRRRPAFGASASRGKSGITLATPGDQITTSTIVCN